MSDWIEVSESGDAWNQKEPIEGVFSSTKHDVGPNKSNMYMLQTKDGTTGVWGSTVLDSKFEQIPVGSEVRVSFIGLATGKSGKEYKDYKVQYKPAVEKVVDPWKDSEEL